MIPIMKPSLVARYLSSCSLFRKTLKFQPDTVNLTDGSNFCRGSMYVSHDYGKVAITGECWTDQDLTHLLTVSWKIELSVAKKM